MLGLIRAGTSVQSTQNHCRNTGKHDCNAGLPWPAKVQSTVKITAANPASRIKKRKTFNSDVRGGNCAPNELSCELQSTCETDFACAPICASASAEKLGACSAARHQDAKLLQRRVRQILCAHLYAILPPPKNLALSQRFVK
jgi:hypothetical protein